MLTALAFLSPRPRPRGREHTLTQHPASQRVIDMIKPWRLLFGPHNPAENNVTEPLVSICIRNFNCEKFLSYAIESALAQTYPHIEVIVLDDGSTDRTPEVLRAWAGRDERIVVITSLENQGIPAALNVGLRHARAPYVARLDSDDIMMPRRLAAQAAVLESQPDVVLVSCAYEIMDSDDWLKIFPEAASI